MRNGGFSLPTQRESGKEQSVNLLLNNFPATAMLSDLLRMGNYTKVHFRAIVPIMLSRQSIPDDL